jgi:CO/xanthine dehydrogenase FAD-binding subunit
VDGRVRQARVAVGACSEVAQRLPQLETELQGARGPSLGQIVRPEHFLGLTPIDDVRASATYRIDAVATLVARMLDRVAAAGTS